jgi:hypothetical protein
MLETLNNALRFCDTIYVFDNGSLMVVGNSFVKKHSIISVLQITAHNDEVYRNQFRNRVYNMFHHLFWSTPTGHFPKGVFKFNWRLIQIG